MRSWDLPVIEVSNNAPFSARLPQATQVTVERPSNGVHINWHSPNTWLVILPCVYFATSGNFIVGNEIENFSSGAVPSSLARFEQIIAWLMCGWIMLPRYKQIFSAMRRQRYILYIFLYAALTVLWSPGKIDSIRRIVLFLLTLSFGFFLSVKYRPRQQMLLIFGTAALAVFMSLILALASPAYGRGAIGEWRGIFGSKADLGMFFCFLFSPYAFLKLKGVGPRAFAAVCVVLAIAEIILSQSRGAWLLTAVLIGFSLVMLVIRRLASIHAVLFLAVTVLVCVFIGLLIYSNYAAFTYFIGKDPSLTNRTLIWNAVITAIRKHPILGYGYGGFWNGLQGESAIIILTIGVFLSHSHDGFLNITLQLGLVGTCIFFLSFLVAVRHAFEGIFFRRSNAAMWYLSILVLTFVGSIDESFLLTYNSLTTILYVVACAGLSEIARDARTARAHVADF